MKTIAFLIVAAIAGTGCVVHTHPYGRGSYASRREVRCRPSHYWDGYVCRVKGGHRHHHGYYR